jgi:Zn-dependent protease/CBS domain-containing protein
MHSFRIGRIWGIDLRVDWSWVLIFLLLTWNLVAVFSRWHPDWAPAGAMAVAVAASLAFFVCVLLHELAHSVVAIGFGMRVRSITLFLFGGVSNIEREPPSAKAEFLMAIAGPLASILLGVLFLALASVTARASLSGVSDTTGALAVAAQLGPVSTLLLWLGPINIVIGLFNLVPGFPLDGGRILRSVLWRLTGDLRRATVIASGIGQAIGWLFIVAGIAMSFGASVPFFGTGFASGLWLAFIGWFLRSAALQAQTRLALDDALAGLTVEQFMRRDSPVVGPDVSVADVVYGHLIHGDERALPVVKDGEMLGLVCFANVREVPPEQWASTAVKSILRPVESLAVTTPEEPVSTAFQRLAQQNIAQLPVVVQGRFLGMLLRLDITRWLELAWRPNASTQSSVPRHQGPHAHPVTPSARGSAGA